MASSGVHAKFGLQHVFILNGREAGKSVAKADAHEESILPGWTMHEHGFCLLKSQPMAVGESAFEACPNVYHENHVYRVSRLVDGQQRETCLEKLPLRAGADESDSSPFLPYYRDIAQAAKVAFPEAEYVVVRGHRRFDAGRSVFGWLWEIMVGKRLEEWIASWTPTCLLRDRDPGADTAGKYSTSKMPSFPALDGHCHVDQHAAYGIGEIKKFLTPLFASDEKASLLAHPEPFLKGTSTQRSIVCANFWRSPRSDATIRNHHLALVDGSSVTQEELAATKINDNHVLHRVQAHHRFVYFPDMTQSEILAFKQGAYVVRKDDIASGDFSVTPAPEQNKNFIFHSSFLDPTAPNDDLPRVAVSNYGVFIVMPEATREVVG